jgi:uncharacterized repeat protein (TIGR03803 family)
MRRVGKAAGIASAWAVLLGAFMPPLTQAQTFKTLYSFTGGNDGGQPHGPLLLDKHGNVSGTAYWSGNGLDNGTVFRVSASGKFTLLYAFPGQGGNGQSGAFPDAGLIRDNAGNFYSTAEAGGQNQYGVVFKLSPAGKETVLHYFSGPPNDGTTPTSTLLSSPSGVFYGVALGGGSGKCRGGVPVCGIVFSIDSKGNYKVIYNFQGQPEDGLEPWGNLVQDAQGNLYGTTAGGGDQSELNCGGLLFGCGTVFKLSPNSDQTWTETLLYSFTGGADGDEPIGLALDAHGNLYGAALFGGNAGCVGGCGTVYKLDTAGTFTVLHSFTGGKDGAGPGGALLDASGNFYGVTDGGGNSGCRFGCGVVFEVDATGRYTLLHSFSGPDGDKAGFLIFGKTGTLYGTTALGGASNWGTIFKLKP